MQDFTLWEWVKRVYTVQFMLLRQTAQLITTIPKYIKRNLTLSLYILYTKTTLYESNIWAKNKSQTSQIMNKCLQNEKSFLARHKFRDNTENLWLIWLHKYLTLWTWIKTKYKLKKQTVILAKIFAIYMIERDLISLILHVKSLNQALKNINYMVQTGYINWKCNFYKNSQSYITIWKVGNHM